MSFFPKSEWTEWARDWGLTHVPQRSRLKRDEQVLGAHGGLLFRAAWDGDNGQYLVVHVRFPKPPDLERVRLAVADDAALDALPGHEKAPRAIVIRADVSPGPLGARRVRQFTLTGDALLWRRAFLWRAPRAEQLRQWVEALVGAVGRAAGTFDGRCERCATGTTSGFVIEDGLPVYLCGSCQQQLRAEGEMAERTYDMLEARHLPGATLGLAAAIAGAVAWAALAAFTNREYALVPILIGVLVAWVYRRVAGRVDNLGRAIAGGLTVFSVILGQVLLYAWIVARERPDIGFRLDAGIEVYRRMWMAHASQEAMSVVFGLLGAWFAMRALRRPKLRHDLRPAGAPTGGSPGGPS